MGTIMVQEANLPNFAGIFSLETLEQQRGVKQQFIEILSMRDEAMDAAEIWMAKGQHLPLICSMASSSCGMDFLLKPLLMRRS